MFHAGENVVYGTHGVCTVLGTEVRKIDGRSVEYYVLEPHSQSAAKYYVPTHNLAALAKMRGLISSDALHELLHSEEVRRDCWVEDENKRKLLYRELIASGDRERLLQIVYTLHCRKKELALFGKRIHQCDENFLSDAQKLLNEEFSFVLQIPIQAIGEYIANIFEK